MNPLVFGGIYCRDKLIFKLDASMLTHSEHFKRQYHEMVKHTNNLSVFYHFVILALRGLKIQMNHFVV